MNLLKIMQADGIILLKKKKKILLLIECGNTCKLEI